MSFSFLELNKSNSNSSNRIMIVNALDVSKVIPKTVGNSYVHTNPTGDVRVLALKQFFSRIKSPLEDFSEYIVSQADLNGIDYALVPAISMQESGGCKVIPVDSYNCWGFGIYGTKVTRFNSYPQAIERITKVIKETYIKNGLTNPTLLEDKWTPSSRGTWSYSVNYYSSYIHDIERNITAY